MILKSIKLILKVVLYELLEFAEAVLRRWPGHIGVFARRLYYKCRLKYIGKNIIIKMGMWSYDQETDNRLLSWS